MNIREANSKDIDSIVDIHSDAFNGFFLTSLGPDFLKLYYGCFINNRETVTLVAEDDGIIYGFSALTIKSKGFNNRLIKNNLFAFGLFFIKLLLNSPMSLIRLLKNLSKINGKINDNRDYAELYSIGVSRSAQGKGIGKKLLSVSELKMQEAGVKRISLTTDYMNNKSVVSFYNSMGYSTLYIFSTYPNRKMFRLIKTLI